MPENAAIMIAPGFEHLLEPAENKDRVPSSTLLQHRALVAEHRDDPWATDSEGRIREYVESQLDAAGLDRSAVQLQVIECRQTLCEVQATGIAENVGKPDRDPQFMAIGMARGPNASSFANASATLMMLPGNKVGYVLFLERRKP